MKTILILLSACIMAILASSQCEAQAATPYRLENEIWYHSRNDMSGTISGSEMFYFSAEGKFYYITTYSGGVYLYKCYSGTYTYSPAGDSSTVISFDVQSAYAGGHIGEGEVPNAVLPDLSITNITDSTITPRFDKPYHTVFRRQHVVDMLIFPCTNRYIVDPEIATIHKNRVTSAAAKDVELSNTDLKRLVSILNTAQYSKTLNDGRMMKLAKPDFTIQVGIRIRVWEAQLQVGGWKDLFYTLPDSDNLQLFELLNKYFPNTDSTLNEQ